MNSLSQDMIYHVAMDAETYLAVQSLLKRKEDARIKARERYLKEHIAEGKVVNQRDQGHKRRPQIKLIDIKPSEDFKYEPTVSLPDVKPETTAEILSALNKISL